MSVNSQVHIIHLPAWYWCLISVLWSTKPLSFLSPNEVFIFSSWLLKFLVIIPSFSNCHWKHELAFMSSLFPSFTATNLNFFVAIFQWPPLSFSSLPGWLWQCFVLVFLDFPNSAQIYVRLFSSSSIIFFCGFLVDNKICLDYQNLADIHFSTSFPLACFNILQFVFHFYYLVSFIQHISITFSLPPIPSSSSPPPKPPHLMYFTSLKEH